MSLKRIPDSLFLEIQLHLDLALEKNYNLIFILKKNNLLNFLTDLKKLGYDEKHPLYQKITNIILNINYTIVFLNKCSIYTADQLFFQSQFKDVEIPVASIYSKDFVVRFFSILFEKEKISTQFFRLKFN